MTFEEQIAGVPLELVRQGWRREPSNEVWDRWTKDHDSRYRWRYDEISNGQNIRIAKPIKQIPVNVSTLSSQLATYAHAGWGEGLEIGRAHV